MKVTFLFIVSLILFCGYTSSAQVYEHRDSAFRIAQAYKKTVLLIFSGSDWCANCIRFDKKILHDSIFKNYADRNLVLLVADFPQRKKMSAELTRQNDSLAASYDPDGSFPHFALIDPNNVNSYHTISYSTQSAAEFIAEIKQHIPVAYRHE
jgi:thiamine biosynthesis lipoprotein